MYIARKSRIDQLESSDSDDDEVNVQATIDAENRLAEFTAKILEKEKANEEEEIEEQREEEKRTKKKRKLEEHINMDQVMKMSKVCSVFFL